MKLLDKVVLVTGASRGIGKAISKLFVEEGAQVVNSDSKNIIIKKITHGVNFNDFDYRKACVRLIGNESTHMYEHELTAGSDILNRSLEYSKKVLSKSLTNDSNNFNEKLIDDYIGNQKKVMMHTGSLKILDGFKNLYNLRDDQMQESYDTLKQYGNLTGVSIPTVLEKAISENHFPSGNSLLIGITMGFGLDIVEIEKS